MFIRTSNDMATENFTPVAEIIGFVKEKESSAFILQDAGIVLRRWSVS